MRLRILSPEKIILCVVMLAFPAAAAEDHPKAEVFGGYQYTHIGVPGTGANGWNAAITGNPAKWFGLTADFSGAYRNIAGVGLRAHTFTFGPTVTHRGDRVAPFAHLLLGGFRASTGTEGFNAGLSGFAMLAGGGVDVSVSNRVAVRLFQLDWLLWRSAGMSERKNVRVSAGVVFRIN